MEKLCGLLERASEGEVDAMDHLKLDTEKKIKTCSIYPKREDEEDMLKGLDDALYIFEAAKRLKMSHLSHLAKQNVAYLKYIYKSIFNCNPTIPYRLKPQTLAETMRDLMDDVSGTLERMEKLVNLGGQESEEEEEDDMTLREPEPPSALRVPVDSEDSETETEGSETGSEKDGPSTSAKEEKPSHRKKKQMKS